MGSGRKTLVTPRSRKQPFGDNTVLQDQEMEEEVPYYKDYAANATRGVIAALVVVAIFLGYAILDRFVLKSGDGGNTNGKLEVKTLTSHYSKETGATIRGVDNPGMEKTE